MASYNARYITLAALLVTQSAIVLVGCKATKKETMPGSSFSVDQIKVEQVVASDENASGLQATAFELGLPAQKEFAFKACIKDKNLNEAITNTTFTVTDELGVSQERVTNGEGCFLWTERHAYNHLASETYFRTVRTFTAKEIHHGSIKVELGINPWTDKVADLTYEVASKVRSAVQPIGFNSPLVSNESPTAKFEVHEMNMKMDNFDYESWEVQKSLDIKVAQKYHVSFKPAIARIDTNGKEVEEVPVRGKVKMEMVILRTRNENIAKNLEAHLQSKIPVAARITKTFDIDKHGASDFVDLKLAADVVTDLSSSLLAFVTFTPVINGAKMAPSSFYGLVGPFPSKTEITLLPVTSEINPMAQFGQATARARAPEMRPLDAFAYTQGFQKLAVRKITTKEEGWFGREHVSVISEDDLDSFATGQASEAAMKKIAQQLCQAVYGGQSKPAKKIAGFEAPEEPLSDLPKAKQAQLRAKAIKTCLSKPEQALGVEFREFVEEVHGNPRFAGFSNQAFVIETNYALTDSVTQIKSDKKAETDNLTKTRTTNIDISIGGEIGAGAEAGLGIKVPAPIKGLMATLFGTEPELKASATGKINGSAGAGWKFNRTGSNKNESETFVGTVASKEAVRSSVVKTVSSRSISVDAISLAIDVTSQPCAIVTPNIKTTEGKPAGKGAVICSRSTRKKSTVESYYFISPARSDVSLVNNGQGEDALLRQVIRGDKLFEALKGILQDKDAVILLDSLKKLENDPTLDPRLKSLFIDSKLTQESPGILSVQ